MAEAAGGRRFYIDNDYVEHDCCWNSAILQKVESGIGVYGTDVKLVLECDEKDAEMICKALNNFKEAE